MALVMPRPPGESVLFKGFPAFFGFFWFLSVAPVDSDTFLRAGNQKFCDISKSFEYNKVENS